MRELGVLVEGRRSVGVWAFKSKLLAFLKGFEGFTYILIMLSSWNLLSHLIVS